jgi:hypothetical protein
MDRVVLLTRSIDMMQALRQSMLRLSFDQSDDVAVQVIPEGAGSVNPVFE